LFEEDELLSNADNASRSVVSLSYSPKAGDSYSYTVGSAAPKTGSIRIISGVITLTDNTAITVAGSTITKAGTITLDGKAPAKSLSFANAQVSTAVWNNNTYSYTNYSGNQISLKPITYFYNANLDEWQPTILDVGATGSIAGGKFTYKIEQAPQASSLKTAMSDFVKDFAWGYTNVTASSPQVKMVEFSQFSNDAGYMERWFYSTRTTGNTRTDTDIWVSYIYVDGDVALSGKGRENITMEGYDNLLKTNDFSFELKKGWNAVQTKVVTTYNLSAGTASEVITFSFGDTDANNKWIWEGYGMMMSATLGSSIEPTPRASTARPALRGLIR
jgi:hypothetical protein